MDASQRTPGRLTVVLLLALVSVTAQASGGRDSPVQVVGIINRQKPTTPGTPWFTTGELGVIAHRYALVCGLDGHGYDFPGALPQVLALNPDCEALSYWEAMGVGGSRLAAVDLDEDNFLHSADPASLTATAWNGNTLLYFLQDGRGRVQNSWYPPPGVTEYVVEVAPRPSAPFTTLGAPIPDTGLGFYALVDPVVSSQRVYRVRSRIASTGELADYSWTVSANPSATSTLALGRLFEDGNAWAVCYGDCPTDPGVILIEADLDNDHVFEADEQFPCSTRTPLGDGGFAYAGFVGAPDVDDCISHRIVRADDATVSVPLRGAYQTGMYNNRIQMHKFGNYLVWPDRADWLAHTRERLDAVLAGGYRGLRLDFVLDTLDLPWSASGLLHDWQGAADRRVRDAMANYLTTLRAEYPTAHFEINGYFVVEDVTSYWGYLSLVDSADFEFFGIGHRSMSPALEYSTTEAVEAIWGTRAAGRRACALAGAHRDNHAGRLNVLAMYLLIMDAGTYLYNETDPICQDVVWLPEWEVPLGAPLAPVSGWAALLDSRGALLLARAFAHGEVVYNCHAAPVTLQFDEARFRLSVTGGLSQRVGGDGAASYTPVNSVTLQQGESAILLTSVPGDVNADGQLDVQDVLGVFACLSGAPDPIACGAGDDDGDGDVDLHDIAALQVWYSGQ